MAQVTFGTPAPARHVIGDLVLLIYVVSGASGSTLVVPMSPVLFVAMQPFCQAGTASVITGIAVAGGTVPTTSIVTLTSAQASMVNEEIVVIGRVG